MNFLSRFMEARKHPSDAGAYPAFRIPTKGVNPNKFHWRGWALGLAWVFLAIFVLTQAVALTLHFPRAIYPPWMAAVWCFRYEIEMIRSVQLSEHIRDTVYATIFAHVVIAIGMMAIVIVTGMWEERQNDKGKEDLHGSARFQTRDEVVNSDIATATDGPFIGAFDDLKGGRRVYVRDDSADHILAFAPSGSAKTVGLIVPTLLDIPKWSVICLDPKEQIHGLTSGYRSKHGRVFKFAPLSMNGSRYNLFSEIRLGTMRDVSDAQNIAEVHCNIPDIKVSDPHWIQIAKSLITGLVLHEAYKAKNEGRIATGREIGLLMSPITKNPDGSMRTFMNTLAEMIDYPHDPDGLKYGWTLPDGTPTMTHPVVIEKAMEMLNRVTHTHGTPQPNDEFSGALSTAKQYFELYADPLIQRNTGFSDFQVMDLVDNVDPCTLYIVIPLSDQKRLAPLVRVFITTMLNRYTEDKIARKHRMLVCLEEFPTLGNMEIVKERIALARDYGLKFYLICQSIKQIEDAYTAAATENIIENCGCRIAYTPNSYSTAEELSKMTGKRTVTVASSSFQGRVGAFSKDNVTTTVQRTERQLMMPDEILRLRPPKKMKVGSLDRIIDPGDMLIFRTGRYPILGRQLLYFFDPKFQQRAALPEVTEWPRIRKQAVS